MSSFEREIARQQVECGLPAEPLLDSRIYYNAHSATIILTFVLSKDRIPHSRLYLRGVHENRYRSAIELADEELSIEGPVICQAAPLLFFTLNRWVRTGTETVGEQLGIGRLDLLTGEHELWNTENSTPERFFVAGLAGADSSGTVLYAVCGFRAKDGVGYVSYGLARLEWESRSFTKLALLDGIFF